LTGHLRKINLATESGMNTGYQSSNDPSSNDCHLTLVTFFQWTILDLIKGDKPTFEPCFPCLRNRQFRVTCHMVVCLTFDIDKRAWPTNGFYSNRRSYSTSHIEERLLVCAICWKVLGP
jgi:hypothetical protein